MSGKTPNLSDMGHKGRPGQGLKPGPVQGPKKFGPGQASHRPGKGLEGMRPPKGYKGPGNGGAKP
jgi:hypothetical protein